MTPATAPSEPTAIGAPWLPPGRRLKLQGRGTTFVRELQGPAGAPTVVLLHGLTATADVNWFTAFKPLGRHFNVVAMDHRGHGRGIRSWRPFRLEDCADDVAALVRELNLTDVILVGYSMGGPIAQLTWRRHPDLVDGLVLCATARSFARRDPRSRLLFSSLLGLSAAARITPPRVRVRVANRFVNARAQGGPIADWIAGELRRGDASSILQAASAIGSFRSSPWLGEVNVPTAVVLTRRDQLVSPARQQRLADSIPGATVHPVDADHAACVIAARRFIPALLDACASVSQRAFSRGPARSSSRA